MLKTALMSAALAIGVAGSAPAATVIFSDNFDTETPGTPQTVLANWTITAPTIDVIGSGPNGTLIDFYAGNGYYLDMTGTPGAGGIKTAVALGLISGHAYELSFDYGNNKNSNGVEQLTFGLGTQTGFIDIPGAVANLTNHTMRFVYDGSGDYLTFADTGSSTSDYGGPILDNVSLAAVPLPAGGLLLLGALGGIAALRRRKAA